jgi:hypothetical protein
MEPSYTCQVMSIWCYPHVFYWDIYCVLRCHCRRLHKGALNKFSVNQCTGLFINFLRIWDWCNSWLASIRSVGGESAKKYIWDLSGFRAKALISIYYSTIISIHNAERCLSNDVCICKSFRIAVLTCLPLLKTRKLFEWFAGYCCVPLDDRSFKLRM